MKRRRIVIVEDECWIRRSICRMVARIYDDVLEIWEASDGEDALQILSQENTDLILTDLNMPFIDGLTLIRIMQDKNPDIPVLVLSGYSEFELVREALIGGALDYLLKPVQESMLRSAIDKALKKLDEIDDRIRSTALSSYLCQKGGVNISNLPKTLRNHLTDFRFPLVLLVVRFCVEYLPVDFLLNQPDLSPSCIFRDIYHQGTFFLLLDKEQDIEKCCRRLIDYAGITGCIDRISRGGPMNDIAEMPDMYKKLHFKTVRNLIYKKGLQYIQLQAEDIRINSDHRISLEMEAEIHLALTQKKKEALRHSIIERLGLNDIEQEQWLLIEVQQLFSQFRTLFFPSCTDDKHKIYEFDLLFDSIEEAILRTDTPTILELLNQIITLVTASGDSKVISARSPDDLTEQVREYIDLHYADNLTLSRLAEKYYIAPSYLSRVFKKYTGENLVAYITEKRLTKARELILTSNISLTDVAFLVGYSDYTYFNKVFRRYEGISPAQYREQYVKSKKSTTG